MKKPISEIIRWWEDELTDSDRTQLMAGYVWHGTVEERHKKLREMCQQFKLKENHEESTNP